MTALAEAAPFAVCFGSPGVDLLLDEGVTGPDYIEGAKTTKLSTEDEAWIDKNLQMLGSPDAPLALPSGGVLGVFARLAVLREGSARIVTVVGDKSDPASRFLQRNFNELEALGADTSYLRKVGGYTIQAATVEKGIRDDKTIGNRMIRIREGMHKAEHLGAPVVAAACADANLVVLAGVKDMKLNMRILDHAPEDTFLAGCWGTCDVTDKADDVRRHMEHRRYDLLTANEHESGAILGFDAADTIDDAKRHAAALSDKYSRFAICTFGAAGMAYAHNGNAEFEPALPDPPGKKVHTLGAGDSVLAVASHFLSSGFPIETAVKRASRTANNVIRYKGAYEDLDRMIRSLAYARKKTPAFAIV